MEIGKVDRKKFKRWIGYHLFLSITAFIVCIGAYFVLDDSDPGLRLALRITVVLGILWGALLPVIRAMPYLGNDGGIRLFDSNLYVGSQSLGWSIVIDDVQRLRLRSMGSLLSMGMDKGLGIALSSPASLRIRGKPARPISFAKSHAIVPDIFDIDLSDLILRIHQHISELHGRRVEICHITRRGREQLVVRDQLKDGQDVSEAVLSSAAELVCIECGYDLRGQSLESRCPECGTFVLESNQQSSLSRADANWVRGLRRGAMLLAITGVASAFVAWWEVEFFVQYVTGPPPGADWLMRVFIAGTLTLLPLLLGVVFFTRRQPQRTASTPDFLTRSIARYAVGLPLLLVVAIYYGRWRVFFGFMPRGIVMLIVGLSLLFYLRRVWDMVPDARGRQLTTFACSALCLILLCVGSAHVVLQIGMARTSSPPSVVARPTPRAPVPPPPVGILVGGAIAPGLIFALVFAAFWVVTIDIPGRSRVDRLGYKVGDNDH